jgi:hypothetical protein
MIKKMPIHPTPVIASRFEFNAARNDNFKLASVS